jgi:gamma-glutamyltranspeptidase/glutathione hydrolase
LLVLLDQAPTEIYRDAAVVSDSLIASDVGAEIMKRGGNAFDAAAATGLALAVTYPAAGNLGGGGFMVARLESGETVSLDFREVAPLLANRDMYLGKDGEPTQDSVVGYRAVGVPGSPAGLFELHKKYGKLKWTSVVEPAIRLAERGFTVHRSLHRGIQSERALLAKFPASSSQFLPKGSPPAWGSTLKQPDLGKTLRRLQARGADGFYRGETANLLVSAMKSNGGLIRHEDLVQYRPQWRKALIGRFRGYEIATMPPPSSGGIALLQMLGMLEKDDLSSGPGSVNVVHLQLEAMKRAFADRAIHLGDPDFHQVPIAGLLSEATIQAHRNGILRDRATPSDQITSFIPEINEGENTTHFSIVDAAGNAVAITTTLNTSFGSGVVAPGTGFLLNNEMDDFAAKVGRPNSYGLLQGEGNAIVPKKRPLSSMTPTIVSRNGRTILVLGSPGGPTIINTVFQTILNVLVHRQDVGTAVAWPRLHHQWQPDAVRWEPFSLTGDAKERLTTMGHKFESSPRSMGSCHAI